MRDVLYNCRQQAAILTNVNNTMSRTLKELLRGVPQEMRRIAAASAAASAVMADQANASQAAAEQQAALLAERLQLIRGLQTAHNDTIYKRMKTTAFNGHILALPFSDSLSEAVSRAVLNSGIHRTVNDHVKFSMATYVEPLGAEFVCCIWIYVAAVHDRT